jgi:hypothetical protein
MKLYGTIARDLSMISIYFCQYGIKNCQHPRYKLAVLKELRTDKIHPFRDPEIA